MNPQEKKKLSYQKDCRNVYGENDKSSRKNIRRRKQGVNRSFRRGEKQDLSRTDLQNEEKQDFVNSRQREHWKKSSDIPLGKILLDDASQGLQYFIWKYAEENASFLAWLEEQLVVSEMNAVEVSVIMRRANAVARDRNSSELKLSAEAAKLLDRILKLWDGNQTTRPDRPTSIQPL